MQPASNANGCDLAVVILTRNEEIHLARALHNVMASGLAKQVFVIDSHSTDRTVDIAREHGAVVLQNRFVNQSVQFQWAMDHAPITCAWVMRLDADELIEADLAATLKTTLPALPPHVVGINLQRKHIFLGRWIRHGGRYPLEMLRIWRRGHGQIENRWMDEHITVSGGDTVTLKGGFADHNLNDLPYFIDKHNKYATREAIEIINQRRGLFERPHTLTAAGASWQAAAKRAVKTRLYNQMPFGLAALFYFLYRYTVQLGFLDGTPGLIYHVLQGFWYRFLVGARVVELESSIAHLTDRQTVVAELSRLTKLDLQAAIAALPAPQPAASNGKDPLA